MNNTKFVAIRRIFNIIFSISIFVAGICLIAGCLSIYDWGEGAYTRQLVIDTFAKICVPVYICLALTIACFVWDLILPNDEKVKKFIPYEYLLLHQQDKKDLELCEGEVKSAILKEQKKRKAHTIIRTIIICIAISVFFVYAFNPENYTSDINSSVIKAMWVLTPCLIIPFAYSVFASIQNEKSIKREIELYKTVPSGEKVSNGATDKCDKATVIIRFAVLFIGIGCLVYGYFAGGTADVLTKAINICTECIGLG